MSLREDLEYYGGSSTGLVLQFRREQPEDYNDFIDVLYHDIDILIGSLEADAKDFINSHEDVINRALVRLLKAKSYRASHDSDEGGHVDIYVCSIDSKYSWLAEAKRYKGVGWIEDGLNQLTDRYSRGTPGHDCGGILVYIQKDKCCNYFSKWRTRLEEYNNCQEKLDKFGKIKITNCEKRPGMAFYSQFTLPRTGNNYKIRHLAVSLYRTDSVSNDLTSN